MRRRRTHRQDVAERVRSEFVPPEHAVVHWDSKLMKVCGLAIHDYCYRCPFVNPYSFFVMFCPDASIRMA